MKPKKHPRADLERWRSIFFLAGLLLVLLAVVGIIQIKRQVSQPQVIQSAEASLESVSNPHTKTEVKEEA
ncbi:MAG: hypothetical protein U5L96_20040 [Owenweeksia sp.]|nr:hypothetical protein [Owenweeksia sp.]